MSGCISPTRIFIGKHCTELGGGKLVDRVGARTFPVATSSAANSAAIVRSQQNNPRPLQITLQCRRRATTSFQRLAIVPSKANFSCFGNHPDLESRLHVPRKVGTSGSVRIWQLPVCRPTS
jgi:hypothetical protein